MPPKYFFNRAGQQGKGTSEYIIIVLLMAISAITATGIFGSTTIKQTSNIARSLAGEPPIEIEKPNIERSSYSLGQSNPPTNFPLKSPPHLPTYTKNNPQKTTNNKNSNASLQNSSGPDPVKPSSSEEANFVGSTPDLAKMRPYYVPGANGTNNGRSSPSLSPTWGLKIKSLFGVLATATHSSSLNDGEQDFIDEYDRLYRKMESELTRLGVKPDGPPSTQYTLRAKKSGEYKCYHCPSGTIQLEQGEIWRIGKSNVGTTRYSQAELLREGVYRINEFHGTEKEALIVEKIKLYTYYIENGHRPPGNKIMR